MYAMKMICLLFATITSAHDSEITRFMKHLEVIPDLIGEGPRDFLNVTYQKGIKADKGVELRPIQVKDKPKVTWLPESKDTYYTLIMTDPDAPSREEPILKEWHHWLVINIPGNDLEKGEELTEYFGAAPPKDSGLHRYVFLLYKQRNGKQEFEEERLSATTEGGRAKFSTIAFVKKHNLAGPVAGNFFSAEYDDFVPELYEKLM